MSRLTTYYTSYSRAVLKARNNGFWARVLDVEEAAVIERIRRTGRIRCGSLGDPVPTDNTYSDDIFHRVALLEEMDFWQSPSGAFHIPRHGPVDRPPKQPREPTPHALEIKRRRALKNTELAAEIARAEEKQRELLRRDLEWEAAAPKPMPFGRTGGLGGRHYIPQWQVEEWRQAEQRIEQAQAESCRLKKEKDAELTRQAEASAEQEQQSKAEAERKYQGWIDYVQRENIKEIIEPMLKTAFPTGHWPELGSAVVESLMKNTGVSDSALMKQCVDELAKANRIEQQTKAELERIASSKEALDRNYKENIKQSIHAILKRAFPYGITLEQLMRQTGATDFDLIKTCVEELSAELNAETFPHRGGTAARIPS